MSERLVLAIDIDPRLGQAERMELILALLEQRGVQSMAALQVNGAEFAARAETFRRELQVEQARVQDAIVEAAVQREIMERVNGMAHAMAGSAAAAGWNGDRALARMRGIHAQEVQGDLNPAALPEVPRIRTQDTVPVPSVSLEIDAEAMRAYARTMQETAGRLSAMGEAVRRGIQEGLGIQSPSRLVNGLTAEISNEIMTDALRQSMDETTRQLLAEPAPPAPTHLADIIDLDEDAHGTP